MEEIKNKILILCLLVLLNSCYVRKNNNYLNYKVRTTTFNSENILIKKSSDVLQLEIINLNKLNSNQIDFSYKDFHNYSIHISQFESGIQLIDNYYFELFKDLLIDIYKDNNIKFVVGMEGNKKEVKQGKFKLYEFRRIGVITNDLFYVCDNKNGCYMNLSYLINQKSEVPTKIKFEYYDSDNNRYFYDIKLIKRK